MGLNLDNMDEELKNKIMSLQNLQRTLEFLSQQNMQIQSSLRETEVAIEELEKADSAAVVYKSIGGIMLRSEVPKLLDEKKIMGYGLAMPINSETTRDLVHTFNNIEGNEKMHIYHIITSDWMEHYVCDKKETYIHPRVFGCFY